MSTRRRFYPDGRFIGVSWSPAVKTERSQRGAIFKLNANGTQLSQGAEADSSEGLYNLYAYSVERVNALLGNETLSEAEIERSWQAFLKHYDLAPAVRTVAYLTPIDNDIIEENHGN